MSADLRVAAFAALLAVIFATAALAGRAIDPGTGSHDAAAEEHGHAAADPATPAGLSLVQDGLRLVAADTTLSPGRPARFAFGIVDARGATVRAFDTEQGRRMHLIVVRRDLTGYQHLHPEQTRTGAWTTALRLPDAGAYRAFADFRTGGRRLTLGVDLLAPGAFVPHALPAPATTAHVGGYDVALHGQGAGALSFTVRRRGTPVTDLQPYLGTRGHLVVVRRGDLAYEHVHPLGGRAALGEIAFESGTTAPGSYRLFLQFRHGGRVHTVAFTREVTP
ncbi:MAG: hypothetical protein ACR2H2_13590 [Solirubrobacteraceae bacterium]